MARPLNQAPKGALREAIKRRFGLILLEKATKMPWVEAACKRTDQGCLIEMDAPAKTRLF